MKARVHVDESKIILSIGMIVKNEERFLRDCLNSLKPLMNQVRCELIIVDTGSTDKTVEIAKEFTDQVLSFEWCNDFSAARNHGLSRATGEWFMFIDADEHFVEVQGIVDFLKGSNKNNFDFASYTLRNFFNAKRESYADYPARRLVKKHKDVFFQHPVHEGIDSRPNDISFIITEKAMAYHFGYSSEIGKKSFEAKHKRNLDLLNAQLEIDPDDTHMIIHMVKESISYNEADKAIEFCLRGLDVQRRKPTNSSESTCCFLYNRLISLYLGQSKTNKMLEAVNEYFSVNKTPHTTDMDIYYNRAAQYLRLSEFENAIADYEKYFEGYQAYTRKELLTGDMFVDPIVTTQSEYYYRALSTYSICLTKIEKYDQAQAALNKINLKLVEPESNDLCYLVAEFTLIEKTENYDRIPTLYKKICELKSEKKRVILERYIDNFIIGSKDIRVKISQDFLAGLKNWDTDYIKLHKLMLAEAEKNSDEACKLLKHFLNNKVESAYSDVLYFALKENLTIPTLAKVVDFEEIGDFIVRINQKYIDYSELFCNYLQKQDPPETALDLRFSIALQEYALADPDLKEDSCLQLFHHIVQDLIDYVYNTTEPQMLTSENIQGLSKMNRFAYYMAKANEYLATDRSIDYIKSLKSALHNYQTMKKPIELISAGFEKQMEEQEKEDEVRRKEFNAYASTIKAKVRELIKAGEKTAASQVLDSLEKLLPNDKDAKQFRATLLKK